MVFIPLAVHFAVQASSGDSSRIIITTNIRQLKSASKFNDDNKVPIISVLFERDIGRVGS